MRLLRRRPRTFDIQVQDMVLHVTAAGDLGEETRAAALSFWEQLHAYALRDPAVRTSKRPVEVGADAPEIVREMAAAAARAGVGPMYSFRGALADHVGRFLARELDEVTVGCGGDFFIAARKRQKLTIRTESAEGRHVAIVVPPERGGLGVSTAAGGGAAPADGLAVLADSSMLAAAAAAGVRAILPKEDGLRLALAYLRRVPGVRGGVVVRGDRIGLAGGVEVAA
ncbi:hypothetical protein HRbin12_01269 [bacterium HR12]|nr:hypothetical protein HRbin12_01269 [bacterium HR12]GIU98712.1 MAG: thiamine biosynthesis protein ApbE [Actinomycetota bacterium]